MSCIYKGIVKHASPFGHSGSLSLNVTRLIY
jgi:hypothetical protein